MWKKQPNVKKRNKWFDLPARKITKFRRLKYYILQIRMSSTKSLFTIHKHMINVAKSSNTTQDYHCRTNFIKNLFNSSMKDHIPSEIEVFIR